ncbi:hypothetical protein CKAN_02321500 [Cinnamomum micranthum f. kanehirae]|uniref:Uncharacterized protein n=1 Tax=Cinnamomum micranthum f. kanehirae TaxID=337451 RepID=A0A3S3P5P7_9MAGN|nr:hypothetical protein CKAN_02321500 [Cinnamomum micranthum f. kanehirae]
MSQPQTVIPGSVYPQSETIVQPPTHTRGSFGPVFIALSVIIVLAMLACFLGRLLVRLFSHPNSGGGGRAPRPSIDVEDSFEISISRPATGRRGERGGGGGGNGGRKEPKVANENGGIKAGGKHVENGEPKTSSV